MDRAEALRLAATLEAGRLASMEGDGYVSDSEVVTALYGLADAILAEDQARMTARNRAALTKKPSDKSLIRE
ncbi:hypothetical protein [Chromobacterium sp. IIBBL 290-4]|uniref:hypothetical protein n=1 Tax=Chromobacterium sp. IIBBL 290-4 TaxID=2953890 RepID=UPI0020B7AA29|nr:hypothetical protein [Chromobacterium sp. IIBBL 290-4]UTH73752.1 hypothetical protein NKT35_19745 [Chromobacterium sp. IIBBL 290-4]